LAFGLIVTFIENEDFEPSPLDRNVPASWDDEDQDDIKVTIGSLIHSPRTLGIKTMMNLPKTLPLLNPKRHYNKRLQSELLKKNVKRKN
jgi:hypothetical protein